MSAPAPEFSHVLRLHEIGTAARSIDLLPSDIERAALARRFDLITLDALRAQLKVWRTAGAVHVEGIMQARGAQACVVSSEPVPFDLEEAVALRFIDGAAPADDEVELTTDALDDLPIEGDALDLGEITAQSLGLGLDPWPRASEAVRAAFARYLISEAEAEARAEAAKKAANPFSALKK